MSKKSNPLIIGIAAAVGELQRENAALSGRVAALEAAQNGSGAALFDGEAAVLKDGLLLPPEGVLGLRGHKRVRVVIYADEGETQS